MQTSINDQANDLNPSPPPYSTRENYVLTGLSNDRIFLNSNQVHHIELPQEVQISSKTQSHLDEHSTTSQLHGISVSILPVHTVCENSTSAVQVNSGNINSHGRSTNTSHLMVPSERSSIDQRNILQFLFCVLIVIVIIVCFILVAAGFP